MKRIFLLLTVLFCSINFYAQIWDGSKPDKYLTFGIRAGANLSTCGDGTWDNYYEIDSQWSFHFGTNVNINVVRSFAIETGVYYMNKGAKIKYMYGNKADRFSYVQVPVLALYKYPVADDFDIHIKGGGYAGYLINEPETLRVKKPDVGVIVGIGISRKKIYLGTHYELGLYKVFGDYKNRNLAISVGYDF